MNENNQPQSQQTKREPGFYHIKIRQYGPRGTDGHEPRINDKWTIAIWDGKDFEEFNELYHEDEVVEIDERRIERASSESSHSPTEQPGDAGFNKLVMDTFHELYPYSSGPHLNELFVMAERATKYERSKQAELVAERDELNNAIAHVWKALGITGYTGKHISEHVSELLAENARLKAECSSHEKERYEIYSFDSSQAMEIKALQSENARLLEQLRSERDKMKSDRDAWKGGGSK